MKKVFRVFFFGLFFFLGSAGVFVQAHDQPMGYYFSTS
ncbi:hypothetical protein LEP1GSC048_0075 [Leptospira santarosai serovar Shermani str. 1342KT]|nr:hypothetical protein LEP1GSC048_0075 [Leptospira santarosai serovar Shermani str. 1342KT]